MYTENETFIKLSKPSFVELISILIDRYGISSWKMIANCPDAEEMLMQYFWTAEELLNEYLKQEANYVLERIENI